LNKVVDGDHLGKADRWLDILNLTPTKIELALISMTSGWTKHIFKVDEELVSSFVQTQYMSWVGCKLVLKFR
jgi:hypothetical protein